MQKRGFSQETLKLIACATMLLDHIAVAIVVSSVHSATGADRELLLQLYNALRTIGRLAFPIFCFLLVEGQVHTRNAKRYGQRLLIGAILAEIPFDLALFGRLTSEHQNVMVTLLLGFVMLEMMGRNRNLLFRLLVIVPFAILAKWLHTDYGAKGIFIIAAFALTREMPFKHVLQFFALWFAFSPDHKMMLNWLDTLSISRSEWAVLAVLPIALYDGRKITTSKAVQWAFYLFYPVHLLVLYLIGRL